jgi:uncharacterized protein YjbJ (UPF0337 family)
MINENVVWGKWKELKGEFITQWGRLTDDELEKTFGNLSSISGIIQQKYGLREEGVEKKLNQITSTFTRKTDELKEHLKAL